MSEDQEKSVEAVSKLIELTQNNEVEWNARYDQEVIPDDAGPDLVYITKFRGRLLRLYKESTVVDNPNAADLFSGSTIIDQLVKGPSGAGRVERIVLEIIDQVGNALWQFPQTDALKDLYEAVQYQTGGVDEFLDELRGLE